MDDLVIFFGIRFFLSIVILCLGFFAANNLFCLEISSSLSKSISSVSKRVRVILNFCFPLIKSSDDAQIFFNLKVSQEGCGFSVFNTNLSNCEKIIFVMSGKFFLDYLTRITSMPFHI
uniref:Uncharacterized protein n=1 Tax=Schizaphis graminum TaxID=13262 RepID=A0A2S2NG80_SCHGA